MDVAETRHHVGHLPSINYAKIWKDVIFCNHIKLNNFNYVKFYNICNAYKVKLIKYNLIKTKMMILQAVNKFPSVVLCDIIINFDH